MTTITIDNAILEQAIDALAGYRRELGDSQPCDAEQELCAALAAKQPAPAWHDAPDKPGIWLCDEGDICYTWTAHSIEILDIKPEDDARWFGPIPEDTK